MVGNLENKLVELPIIKIKVNEASSYTYMGRGRYVKQPKIEFVYNGESYFIIDRNVCYKLIKQFEPNITWTEWNQIQDFELSLFGILEDYFKEYSHYILTCWYEKDNGSNIIYGFESEDASFGSMRLSNAKSSIMYMAIESLADWDLHTTKNRITISNGKKVIEIQETENSVIVRARFMVGSGFVQTMPAIKIMGIIETIQWKILYDNIMKVKDSLENIDKKDEAFKCFKNIKIIKNTSNMKAKEKDDLEYQWFLNSFY